MNDSRETTENRLKVKISCLPHGNSLVYEMFQKNVKKYDIIKNCIDDVILYLDEQSKHQKELETMEDYNARVLGKWETKG